MAWATSQSVGCAWAVCKNGVDNVAIVVCRYTPAGNTAGVKAYVQGPTTCSACPPTAAPCDKTTGLCVKPPDYKLFPAADQAYFLNKFNTIRSQMALGKVTWNNRSWDEEHDYPYIDQANETIHWPASKATYQLKWDTGLALSAGKKLGSLKYVGDTGVSVVLNGSVGLFGYNLMPCCMAVRQETEKTLQQMIHGAWFSSWYGWLSTYGTLKAAYHTVTDNTDFVQVQEDYGYTYLAGSARKIGCAYRNDTVYWAILCYTWPKGLTVNSAFYPTGTPACASCPTATAPCTKATGLCVLK
ncbi:unnamed protein product, partial [Mesorhabditis belari]|uniref:SCP domain-containing protein n=1 Tax=Mesorhabditis belari TaxID=2138241 RepID=A0AAF3EKW0_9BILA